MKRATAAAWDPILILGLGLAVRLLWLFFGFWIANDAYEYSAIGRSLVTYGTFSLHESGAPPTAFRPPLYPILVAALWRGDDAPFFAAAVVNVLLGTFTVLLTYLIGLKYFGRSVAIIGAVLTAIAPMTCLFTVTPLSEPLFTFLVVLAAFFWSRARSGLSGVALGLAALTRPLALPFILVVAALPLLRPWRRKWKSMAVMSGVALLLAGVWTVRNAVVMGEFIPAATNGGINLLSGAISTDSGGRLWDGQKYVAIDFASHPLTRVDGAPGEVATDRIRLKRAFELITSDPAGWITARVSQYPKLFIYNGDHFLGGANLPLREAVREGNWVVLVVKGVFIGGNVAVMLLAVAGLWMSRSRLVELTPIWTFPVFGAVFHLPLWIEPRYFLPMMPMVFILAGVPIRSMAHSLGFFRSQT